MRSTLRIVCSLGVVAFAACQPPSAAPPRPREAPPQPQPPQPPPQPLVPDVVSPRPEDDDDVVVPAVEPTPLAEPVTLDRPRASPAVLCPAPLNCETSRKTFTVGPIREVVVLQPRSNRDASTYALRTARGWFGNPLDPQAVSSMRRSQHTPGSTALDLNISTSNQDGVELFTVARTNSFMPGQGAQGSSSHLNVYSTFCKVNDTGAVVCLDRGMVYSRNCGGGGQACQESGTRPAGLSIE